MSVCVCLLVFLVVFLGMNGLSVASILAPFVLLFLPTF